MPCVLNPRFNQARIPVRNEKEKDKRRQGDDVCPAGLEEQERDKSAFNITDVLRASFAHNLQKKKPDEFRRALSFDKLRLTNQRDRKLQRQNVRTLER